MATQVTSPNGTAIYLSGAPEYRLVSDYVQNPPVNCTYIYANSASIARPIIRTKELHLHAADITTIDPNATIVSAGASGAANTTLVDTEALGGDAGSVVLSAAKFNKFNSLRINAKGGDGGKGYSSPDHTVASGVGGDGGKGGNILLMVNTAFDLIADGARHIINDTTKQPADKANDMLAWAQLAQTVSAPNAADGVSWAFTMKIDQSQPDMDPDGPLPHAVNANTFLALMQRAVDYLDFESAQYLSSVNCAGGNGGHGGGTPDQRTTGAEGKSGTAGVASRTRLEVANVLTSTECLFHPDQVELTMRDIENSYYIGTTDSVQDTKNKLLVLTDRLSFLDTIKPTDNIYMAYAKNELATLNVLPGASSTDPTSIVSLKTSLRLARNYLSNIKLGLDFYRHLGTWVPRGSYKVFSANLDNVLNDFDSVEANYLNYVKLASDQANREQQITNSRYAAERGSELADSAMKTVSGELTETAGQIATLQDEIPAKCQAVQDELTKFQNDIKTRAEWPKPKEFLSAASMMAFCPEESMAVVQTGTLVTQSATQVHTQAGDAVEKSYVVQQINQLGEGLAGLKEGLQLVGDNPQLAVDDPGATKLLGNQQQIMDLVNQYSGDFGDDLKHLKAMFDDYVNTIIQRNNQIIHYNTLITVYLECINKKAAFEATKATLGTQEAMTINSGMPAMAATVTKSYLAYTSKVMELLYDTQKALTFYTLETSTANLSSLRDDGFPSQGLGARLKAKKADMIMDFTNATDNLSNGRQAYGTAAGSDGQPKRVDLSQWQLTALKTRIVKTNPEYFTSISIPVATAQSSIDVTPFAGNADIRVSNVRVYLDGAKTADGILRLTIQQMGDETLVTVHNEQRRFSHNRLVFAFEYEIATGKVLVDRFVDGDDGYALPGPFATWRIGVSTLTNKSLDLSGVTKAWFEFSGYSRMFR
jgi:hypothetical protein